MISISDALYCRSSGPDIDAGQLENKIHDLVKEIVGMVMDKAVTTSEYYRSRCKEFEQKYGMGFSAFKKKVESAKTENTAEWDDMLVWEGFELAYAEWKNKSKELRKCRA